MKTNFKRLSVLIILAMSSLLITLPSWGAESANNSTVKQQMGPVSINKATAKELSKALKGVGKAKAEAIVAYRDSNGDFKKIEDLLKVKGIGKKVLENNKDRMSL